MLLDTASRLAWHELIAALSARRGPARAYLEPRDGARPLRERLRGRWRFRVRTVVNFEEAFGVLAHRRTLSWVKFHARGAGILVVDGRTGDALLREEFRAWLAWPVSVEWLGKVRDGAGGGSIVWTSSRVRSGFGPWARTARRPPLCERLRALPWRLEALASDGGEDGPGRAGPAGSTRVSVWDRSGANVLVYEQETRFAHVDERSWT
mmetsp:Transcript_25195/g.84434  ORF Transcript_25195/g.84434 Transcript_25195/m.84434 type:complete len:208 (+) Transcript_25195:2-625(+)